jgi:hypothetical protein
MSLVLDLRVSCLPRVRRVVSCCAHLCGGGGSRHFLQEAFTCRFNDHFRSLVCLLAQSSLLLQLRALVFADYVYTLCEIPFTVSHPGVNFNPEDSC